MVLLGLEGDGVGDGFEIRMTCRAVQNLARQDGQESKSRQAKNESGVVECVRKQHERVPWLAVGEKQVAEFLPYACTSYSWY